MADIPRTELVETALAAGNAIVATIHDIPGRIFDVHCSADGPGHGRFFSITYSRAATVRDIDRARQTATDAGNEHADTCGATS